jgi:hypothetical protein
MNRDNWEEVPGAQWFMILLGLTVFKIYRATMFGYSQGRMLASRPILVLGDMLTINSQILAAQLRSDKPQRTPQPTSTYHILQCLNESTLAEELHGYS